jgi:MFS family permease
MSSSILQSGTQAVPDSQTRPSHFQLVFSQTLTTPAVLDYTYSGSGTISDPYLVDWLPNDPKNPHSIVPRMKWLITLIMAFGTLSVTLSSSVVSATLPQIEEAFSVSPELAIASVSLFVLGFAIGPMTWAPLSELYGRQVIYLVAFSGATLFSGLAIVSKNIETLLVMRFFAGLFGASAIVNSAGVISDIFVARERGLAIMVYTSAPFLGPAIGPLCGGYLAQAGGWKWVAALPTILTGVMLLLGAVFVPETYTPYLLIRRAKQLSCKTGKVYKSKLEVGKPEKTTLLVFREAIGRPWTILLFEPIVLALSVYSAIGWC